VGLTFARPATPITVPRLPRWGLVLPLSIHRVVPYPNRVCPCHLARLAELESTETAIRWIAVRNAFRDKFMDAKLTTLFNSMHIESGIVN